MAKPAGGVVSWSTVGTRTVPTAPQKAAGFVASDKPPASWANWLWGVLGDWTTYLNSLETESLTWSGVLTFSTAWLLSGSVEGAYSAARTRRVIVPVSAFNATAGNTWTYAPNGSGDTVWEGGPTVTPELLVGQVRVPNGAIVTNVRVAIFGNNTTDTCFMAAYKERFDRAAGSHTLTALGASTTFDLTGGYEVKDQTGAIAGADGTFTEADVLVIEVSTGTSGAGTLQVQFAEITYTETRATGSN